MTIEYELTEQEFLDYNYYVNWQSPDMRSIRVRRYLFSVISFLVLGSLILYVQGGDLFSPFNIILLLSGAVIIALLIMFRLRPAFDKNARRLLEKNGIDTILGTTALTITEACVTASKKNTDTRFEWNAFKQYRIVNNCYYLFINTRQAIVIPFRAFNSNDQRKTFEELLERYLPLMVKLAAQ